MLPRPVPQARIAVNSRCGHACVFCRPSGEALPSPPARTLSLTSVLDICRVFKQHGVREFKLTGGDPALWLPLTECVAALKATVEVERIEVISRHPRIGNLADDLFEAGLDCLTVSLDTLNPILHQRLTGVDDLDDILAALRKCVGSGLMCKVNTVVMRGINEAELPLLARFCEREGVAQLKLLDVIKDLDGGTPDQLKRLALLGIPSVADLYTDMAPISSYFHALAEKHSFVQQGELGHPLMAYTLKSGLQVLIKDHRTGAWYSSVCEACNHYPCHDALMAVRLTADKRLQHCLLGDHASLMLSDADFTDLTRLSRVVGSVVDVYKAATFVSTVRPASPEVSRLDEASHSTSRGGREKPNGEVLYAIQRR